MKKLFILTLTLALFYAVNTPTIAQEQPTQQPTAEEQEKEKAEREKNAFRLLDQLIDEAQSLRLTENRVRVQLTAADMLWDKNQSRARSLFQMAGEGVAELGRNAQQPTGNRRNEGNQERRAFQLRQELVMAAARHDAQLAYQLLASTKAPAPVVQATNTEQRTPPRPQPNSEENLEQMLLGRIAALDPKLAAQNAEQMMEKGQFPRTVTEVINQLAKQDPEAATKLADRTVKRIQGANILTNTEATALAQSLLAGGVRLPASPSATNATTPAPSTSRPAVLEQAAYVDLLSAVIDAALKAIPNSQRTPALTRGRPAPGAPVTGGRPPQPVAVPDNQNEQNNARRLLAGLQPSLPAIDQYLPAKAASVRQKLADMGMTALATAQAITLGGGNNMTADSLMQAASTAPAQMQSRLYQQAAFRALEEGNTDRARQIATNNLPANMRDSMIRYIDYREIANKGDAARFEELRQSVARLQTDGEKINLLVQLANDAQKNNPKMAIQLLEEARQITNRRATNYDQFEQQFRVARAFASVDPARSFEVLDPSISQLNELLAAAAVLNGFEINVFRDGELTIQGGSGLTSMVQRVGQELAVLARNDFERAETLSGRFQMTEPRIITKLAIVQGLLNPRQQQQQSGPNMNVLRSLGQNFNIARPE
ncbi:MAG TPA: hypothetical protein VJT15_12485 [Pyrinomonadaceae bacterium]|nr:hypothetical protein [Pyrinomonadaceae bacterium]